MSEVPGRYDAPHLAERERLRLTRSLRQLADCIENADTDELADVMTLVSDPAQRMFQMAQLVFKRPRGE